MKQLDRRQWLKTAGLTGAFTFLGGWQNLSAGTTISPGPSLAAAGNLVNLNANENPYGPSQMVRQAMINAFDKACRYPFRYEGELIELLAKREGVSPGHIVVTAGSTEGLRATGMVYGMEGGEVIAADPTFQSLLSYAEQFGAYVHRVPLNEKLEHDLEEMEKRVSLKTSLIFICNPNNPTGTILPAGKLRDFCESVSSRAMVFSDEAYGDFITEADYPSMVSLVKKGLNVIVSRTFSKVYGLAGIRVGYLIARPDIASRLREKRMAMTNVLALHAAKTALEDGEFYRFSIKRNVEAKQYIYQLLDQLGLSYIQSQTNFIFFKSGRDIQGLITDMLEQGVQIGRPFPPLTKWCRISTGTMEEVKAFGKALEVVMG